jgi:hypothetical protein
MFWGWLEAASTAGIRTPSVSTEMLPGENAQNRDGARLKVGQAGEISVHKCILRMSVEKAGESAGIEAVCFPSLARAIQRETSAGLFTRQDFSTGMAMSVTRSEVGIFEPVPGYRWRSGALPVYLILSSAVQVARTVDMRNLQTFGEGDVEFMNHRDLSLRDQGVVWNGVCPFERLDNPQGTLEDPRQLKALSPLAVAAAPRHLRMGIHGEPRSRPGWTSLAVPSSGCCPVVRLCLAQYLSFSLLLPRG